MNTPNPLDTFFHEAEDLLQQIEEIALDLGDPGHLESSDGEAVNHLFRAFHTIKGSSSMFGLDEIAGFTHHVESALDQVRSGKIGMSPQLVDLVLGARDVIKDLLAAAMNGTPSNVTGGDAIVTALGGLCGTEKPKSQQRNSHKSDVETPLGVGGKDCQSGWRILFRPARDMIQRGLDPGAMFQELRELGNLQVCGITDSIPPLASLDPNELTIHWDLTLHSSCSLVSVKDVFIFVEDDSEISITPLPAGTVAANPVNGDVASASPIVMSVDPAAPERAAAPAKASTVRVAADKLDRLVNLVGELVINQSRLTEAVARRNDHELTPPVEEIERLVSELRDNVLGIRMTPIGATFNRFKRLVYDLSGELEKEIDLITEGAETELDKTVLDQLGDPLVHLIRNSVDHGIERVEERLSQGKSRRGTVRLAATHAGSNVVVSIADDGKGLDPSVIRAKAIEKQIITADAALSESEIFNLIFKPGFSTAKQITNVSGRGVGMDVVKRQIEALRGGIQIQSTLGQGTTISLTLPLTLAIIEGLLIEVEHEQFIVPMSAVTESVELSRDERGRNNGRNVFAVRGELMPYIDLRSSFQLTGNPPDIEKIVIVRHQQHRVGLTVDRVLGTHQTVIQSLGRFYKDTEVVSGATITGDGRVALILDIAGLVRRADERNPVRANSLPRPLVPKGEARPVRTQ